MVMSMVMILLMKLMMMIVMIWMVMVMVVIQMKRVTILLLPAGDLLKGLGNLCLQLSHKRVTLKTISENQDDWDFESKS